MPKKLPEKIYDIIGLENCAKRYGFSVRWVRLRADDGMPHERISGRWKFCSADTDAWVKAYTTVKDLDIDIDDDADDDDDAGDDRKKLSAATGKAKLEKLKEEGEKLKRARLIEEFDLMYVEEAIEAWTKISRELIQLNSDMWDELRSEFPDMSAELTEKIDKKFATMYNEMADFELEKK